MADYDTRNGHSAAEEGGGELDALFDEAVAEAEEESDREALRRAIKAKQDEGVRLEQPSPEQAPREDRVKREDSVLHGRPEEEHRSSVAAGRGQEQPSASPLENGSPRADDDHSLSPGRLGWLVDFVNDGEDAPAESTSVENGTAGPPAEEAATEDMTPPAVNITNGTARTTSDVDDSVPADEISPADETPSGEMPAAADELDALFAASDAAEADDDADAAAPGPSSDEQASGLRPGEGQHPVDAPNDGFADNGTTENAGVEGPPIDDSVEANGIEESQAVHETPVQEPTAAEDEAAEDEAAEDELDALFGAVTEASGAPDEMPEDAPDGRLDGQFSDRLGTELPDAEDADESSRLTHASGTETTEINYGSRDQRKQDDGGIVGGQAASSSPPVPAGAPAASASGHAGSTAEDDRSDPGTAPAETGAAGVTAAEVEVVEADASEADTEAGVAELPTETADRTESAPAVQDAEGGVLTDTDEEQQAPDREEEPPPEGAQDTETLAPEHLVAGLHNDVQAAEGITFEEKIDSVREEVLRGDGHLENPSARSADGHTLDVGGNTPIANVSNWMQGARTAPPADGEEEAAAADAAAGDGEDEKAQDALQPGDRVAAFVLRSGAVTAAQVRDAQERQQAEAPDEALWRVLAEGKGVDRTAVFAGAARVYAFSFADLDSHGANADFTKSVMDGFPDAVRDQMLALGVAPYRAVRQQRREAMKLLFITHDPARPDVSRVMERVSVEYYELQYAPENAVEALISEAFPKKNEYLERVEEDGGMAVDLGANYQEEDGLIDEEALEAEISRSKLINLFEATLVEATRMGASDIHLYPNADKKVEIHFRVDGRLQHWHTEDKVQPEALLAVVKDNAMNVDRFERDAAQDGFIQRFVDDALIRYRVSVMPIANASQEVQSESIVIRVLDDRKVIRDLSKLGLLEGALEKFQHAISQPHGMVIMTGPTGSGKSTTLVAALAEVVSPEVNVLTIEDPVEYIIEGVRQIKLSHKLQLADALRSLLRHDPDVVMVGEMRDRATAELAIKLANTGHLTFSTLHTNDAPSAISRLYKMGIEPFLIGYAINLVVAQRLIRKLCPQCKTVNDDPDRVMLNKLGFSEEDIDATTFYQRGRDDNCATCHGFGFKGRRAISEALHFSRDIRHMIVEAEGMVDEGAIRDQAISEGMLTLQGSAREIVKKGQTSTREMIRVVTSDAF